MPEHVETRSLYNPEKPGVEQVGCTVILIHCSIQRNPDVQRTNLGELAFPKDIVCKTLQMYRRKLVK